MITKCYLLDWNEKTKKIISDICEAIPCFIDCRTVSPSRIEFTIKLREYDITTVERKLARVI